MSRRGLSLVEVLVVFAILGLLIALLLPAVQGAREASRRTKCSSNFRQLGLALANHEAIHGAFPLGSNVGYSCHVTILPFVEQEALYRRIDFSKDADYGNPEVSRTVVSVYVCPSDYAAKHPPQGKPAPTSYACNFGTGVQSFGYNGVFAHIDLGDGPWREGPIPASDITDGLAATVAMSEILVGDGTGTDLRTNFNTVNTLTAASELEDFASECLSGAVLLGDPWRRGRPWTFGDAGFTWYNHVLTPNCRSCYNGSKVQLGAYSAASNHPGGLMALFADGHLEFVSTSVDLSAWRSRGSRKGP